MKRKLSGLVLALLLAAALYPPTLSANQRLYARVSHSIVFISTDTGFGSGVVVKSSGLILTNLHVVHGCRDVTVAASVMRNGHIAELELPGKVLSAHKDYDAALVKVKLPPNARMRAISMAKRQLQTGEPCYAIGNPGLVHEPMKKIITNGIISKASQDVNGLDYIQTTAPVNPGNSGGALINANGELVGIVTFKVATLDGLGFAVPAARLNPDDFAAQHLDRKAEAYDSSLLSQMTPTGIALLYLGMALAFVGWIWFVIVAFKTHVVWGVAVLIFNVAAFAFLFINWTETKRPFAIAVFGLLLSAAGLYMGLR